MVCKQIMLNMESKIQLLHPAGEKAIRMDQTKYDLLREALLNHLKIYGPSNHTEIQQSVTEDFNKNETKFEGSIDWHLEWVKLDLEGRKEIRRIGNTSPVKYQIAEQNN